MWSNYRCKNGVPLVLHDGNPCVIFGQGFRWAVSHGIHRVSVKCVKEIFRTIGCKHSSVVFRVGVLLVIYNATSTCGQFSETC